MPTLDQLSGDKHRTLHKMAGGREPLRVLPPKPEATVAHPQYTRQPPAIRPAPDTGMFTNPGGFFRNIGNRIMGQAGQVAEEYGPGFSDVAGGVMHAVGEHAPWLAKTLGFIDMPRNAIVGVLTELGRKGEHASLADVQRALINAGFTRKLTPHQTYLTAQLLLEHTPSTGNPELDRGKGALLGLVGAITDIIIADKVTPSPKGAWNVVNKVFKDKPAAIAAQTGQASARVIERVAPKLPEAGGLRTGAGMTANLLSGRMGAFNDLTSKVRYMEKSLPTIAARREFNSILRDVAKHPMGETLDRALGDIMTANEARAARNVETLKQLEATARRTNRPADWLAFHQEGQRAVQETFRAQQHVLHQLPTDVQAAAAPFLPRIQNAVRAHLTTPAQGLGLIGQASVYGYGNRYLPRAYPALDLGINFGRVEQNLPARAQEIIYDARHGLSLGGGGGLGASQFDPRSEALINQGVEPYRNLSSRVARGAETQVGYTSSLRFLNKLAQEGEARGLVMRPTPQTPVPPAGWMKVPPGYGDLSGRFIPRSEASAQVLQTFGIRRGGAATIGDVQASVGRFLGWKPNATFRRGDFAPKQFFQGMFDFAARHGIPLDRDLYRRVATQFPFLENATGPLSRLAGRAEARAAQSADYQRFLNHVPGAEESFAEEVGGGGGQARIRAALEREGHLPTNPLREHTIGVYDRNMAEIGGWPDRAWRFYSFLHLEKQVRKLHPTWAADQVAQEAGRLTHGLIYSGAQDAPALGRWLQANNLGPFPAAALFRLKVLRDAFMNHPAVLNATALAGANINRGAQPANVRGALNVQGSYGQEGQEPQTSQNIYLPPGAPRVKVRLNSANIADVGGIPNPMQPETLVPSLLQTLLGPLGGAVSAGFGVRTLPDGTVLPLTRPHSPQRMIQAAQGLFPGLLQPLAQKAGDELMQQPSQYPSLPLAAGAGWTGLRPVAPMAGEAPVKTMGTLLDTAKMGAYSGFRDLRSEMLNEYRNWRQFYNQHRGAALDAPVPPEAEARKKDELKRKYRPLIEQQKAAYERAKGAQAGLLPPAP